MKVGDSRRGLAIHKLAFFQHHPVPNVRSISLVRYFIEQVPRQPLVNGVIEVLYLKGIGLHLRRSRILEIRLDNYTGYDGGGINSSGAGSRSGIVAFLEPMRIATTF